MAQTIKNIQEKTNQYILKDHYITFLLFFFKDIY